ncbi:MAG: UDP-N-acetylmuramoyl-L-alanine--D-glutamate ligase [Acidobacteria bacterium]|nr:UDP-N-acetylmuramoyl-L-alanine--D-glutamate ligase [Acidobacteriota bacterium]
MIERDYSGKRALVVGAARSGIAAAEFLLSRGASVILTDLKSIEELPAAVTSLGGTAPEGRLVLELGGHRAESFADCDLVVVSPGVPWSLHFLEISRRSGIPVMTEVELAFRHIRGRIIGITGSNGKTTTTVLVDEMLRNTGLECHAAGNVGTPLISFATSSTEESFYSVELSSFQLEGIDRFRPGIAALLNLTPDHMDRYPGFDAYVEAKCRIFVNQGPAEFAVLNADDPSTRAAASRVKSTAFYFSRAASPDLGAFVRCGRVIYRDGTRERELFPVEDIQLKGEHNLENVLAASTIAMLAGAAREKLREAVRRFKGVEHRLEWVAEIDGVQYYNDSKATNVDATVRSLRAFSGGVHLIAGGRDKGADFTALRDPVRERTRQIVLIGEAAPKIREALAGTVPTIQASGLAEAVDICRKSATAGEVVLLAPACASFDMFENYEHRGRVFKEMVRTLAAGI